MQNVGKKISKNPSPKTEGLKQKKKESRPTTFNENPQEKWSKEWKRFGKKKWVDSGIMISGIFTTIAYPNSKKKCIFRLLNFDPSGCWLPLGVVLMRKKIPSLMDGPTRRGDFRLVKPSLT